MSRSKRRPTFPELERVRSVRRAAQASLAERQGAALGADAREQLEPLTAVAKPEPLKSLALSMTDMSRRLNEATASYANQLMWPSSYNFPAVTLEYRTAPSAVDADRLAALKDATPYKVERPAAVTVPDMVTCITAWRAWGVQGSGPGMRLDALGRDALWHPKVPMQAVCLQSNSYRAIFGSGYSLSDHAAPEMDCNCGVWAFKELDGLVAALGSRYPGVKVVGNVQLWGRVIETENGYRAEKAYPSELWLLGSSLEELGLIYDVPVRMIR